MKYLVTGGAGFIGSTLVKKLVKLGHKVIVLDDLSTGSMANLEPVKSKIGMIIGSVTGKNLNPAMKDVDVVVHLAAIVSNPESLKNPVRVNDVNVGGTLNVIASAKEAGVKRVVFASSAAVYGAVTDGLFKESLEKLPITPYGVSKSAAEEYLMVLGSAYGVDTVALRFFNVYGPNQSASSPYSGVIAKFITQVLQGEDVTVFGDGTQSRDFVYVDDVVAAIIEAAERKQDFWGDCLNVGTGKSTMILQLAQVLKSVSAIDFKVLYEPARKGDIDRCQAVVSEAYLSLAGWRSHVSFETGLKRTFDWYKEHYGTEKK